MELHMVFPDCSLMQNPELPESRRYLDRVMKETGLDLTGIARKAGIDPSTITRPYNNPRWKTRISLKVLRKIAKLTKVALPQEMDPTPPEEQASDEAELAVGIYELMPPEGRTLTREEKRRLTREIVALARRHYGR